MNRTKTPRLIFSVIAVLAWAMPVYAADRARVANEGDIRDQWMLADGIKLVAPGYPATFAGRGDNVCVAIGYLISPDGTTSDFTLLKAWASSTAQKEPVAGFWDAFAQTSAGALSQWKFKPRPEVMNAQPTYTVATMHFIGKHAADVTGLRNHCRISDLQALLDNDSGRGARRAESRMESLRRSINNNRIIENPVSGR